MADGHLTGVAPPLFERLAFVKELPLASPRCFPSVLPPLAAASQAERRCCLGEHRLTEIVTLEVAGRTSPILANDHDGQAELLGLVTGQRISLAKVGIRCPPPICALTSAVSVPSQDLWTLYRSRYRVLRRRPEGHAQVSLCFLHCAHCEALYLVPVENVGVLG